MTAMKMSILYLSDKRWMNFISLMKHANIFHHPAWITLLAQSYGYNPFIVAILDGNETVIAGLPFVEVESLLTGKRWVSLSFTDHCAPLYSDPTLLDRLVEEINHLYVKRKIPKIELRWEFPAKYNNVSRSEYVLHSVALNPNPENVAKQFHKTHKRNINVAKKRGVTIDMGTSQVHLDAFYRLHQETRKRQGIPIQPKKFFDSIKNNILDHNLGFILLAYKDNECLAGAVFLHWQETLIYKYGASRKDTLNARPNNLLFWHAIRWGCENGYKIFDLGKTELSNKGLRNYKSGWGAIESPLIYSTLSNSVSRSGSGKLKSAMEMVIQKSPSWVGRVTGELLYRHFG